MSLRRFVIYYAPVQHMNGKFAKADYKCSWQPDTDTNGNSYHYGYMHYADGRSLYAYRDKCRNLAVKPVKTLELLNMRLFRRCIEQVKQVYEQLDTDSVAYQHFKQQSRYRSFWGYCIAITHQNGGIFPYPP